MSSSAFEVLCEIEPATGPDLTRVRRQIAVLTGAVDRFLVPDNHLGRATVSSIAVAQEVAALGGAAVACVNSRDRNLLGFRRDLLTAAAYGVNEFLFVNGDEPAVGTRSTDLSVRKMIDEARAYADRDSRSAPPYAAVDRCRPGNRPPTSCWSRSTTTSTRCWSGGRRWKFRIGYWPGCAEMARRISADVPQIHVPQSLISALESDRDAGVDLAADMVARSRTPGDRNPS